ncbi:MAG: PucR family transcriptional regulator ligand-binding domain-containing protein [Tissierellales bacterium]|nr:PucR family transcriptional regulator ligand-binding domain-containing protein [Tissierellales bacterium]
MPRQNGISLEDVLNLPIMSKCKLISGFKGVRNTVSRVNIIADPDIFDWVKEGELLLTTAYSFNKADIDYQKNIILNSKNRDLAGIGIKISPYLERLNDEILEYADELNFPIIEIDPDLPLSEILMEVMKQIYNKQTTLLERIEKANEKFMEIMLEGKSLNEVIDVVYSNIKNPVAIIMKHQNLKYEHFQEIRENLKEELEKDMIKFCDSNLRFKHKRMYEDKVLINGKFVDRMAIPIILRDEIQGYIVSWSIDTPLGGFDLSIMESASTIISLFLLQESNVKEVEIKYRSEFFEDLISADSKRKGKALDRAHFFNLVPNDYYIVEVMSFKFRNFENYDDNFVFDYLKNHSNQVVSTIEKIMDKYKLNGIVSTKLNGIQILIEFNNTNNYKRILNEFNQEMYNAINQRLDNVDIRIGIGRLYKGLENANKSFSDALRTIRTGKELTNRTIITYEELGVFKILCQDSLVDELEDFYQTTLKPLVEYDEKKSTELVKTLQCYFDHNGNLTKMSEALFTHYNTILYRINRIQEITGLNLNDPNDRLNLEIALKIKQML